MSLNLISSHSTSSSGVFPILKFVHGSEQQDLILRQTPFSVGRKVDKDLVIADPRVSRDHAQIDLQSGVEHPDSPAARILYNSTKERTDSEPESHRFNWRLRGGSPYPTRAWRGRA